MDILTLIFLIFLNLVRILETSYLLYLKKEVRTASRMEKELHEQNIHEKGHLLSPLKDHHYLIFLQLFLHPPLNCLPGSCLSSVCTSAWNSQQYFQWFCSSCCLVLWDPLIATTTLLLSPNEESHILLWSYLFIQSKITNTAFGVCHRFYRVLIIILDSRKVNKIHSQTYSFPLGLTFFEAFKESDNLSFQCIDRHQFR